MKKRGNGSGTLIHTKTGLYIAKWEFQGKTYTRSTKCYSKDDALAKLDEFVKPYMEQNDISVIENLQAKIRAAQQLATPIDRVPLDKMFDVFLKDPNVSTLAARTMWSYKYCSNHLVRYIGSNYPNVKYIDQLSRQHAKCYLETISGILTDSTYNLRLTVLKRMSKILLGDNHPFKGFHIKRATVSHQKTILTDEDLKTLLTAAMKRDTDSFYILFTLGIYTGMRLSDCCLLKWDEVDLERNVIYKLPLKTKRTGRYVTIPIHQELRNLLLGIKRTGSEYVCEENANHYLHSKMAARVLSFMRRAGIKQCMNDFNGFHVLRHTFISRCANAGVPMLVIQNIVGHGTMEMVQRYFHMDNSVALSAMTAIRV